MSHHTLLLPMVLAVLSAGVVMPAVADDEPTTRPFTYKTISGGKLDLVVHYPPGWKDTDRRPAIVFFFGGGWANGRITQFETQADHLARRGMVAARADYRVKSRHGVTPDRCVEDAKSAVRWLRANAAKLGIDPERIVAAGGSAGGHIAACTALTEGLEAEEEDRSVSSKPDALVLFNPVLRFDGIPQLMTRIGNDEALGKQLSPTLHVTKDTPPTLLLFGTADRLKPQGDEFLRRAKEVGFRAELFTAEAQPHGFFNRPPWLQRTTARMDEFLTSLGYLERNRGDDPAAAARHRPREVWTRDGPLGDAPKYVTDAYPLSDQHNRGGWVRFEPMSDEFEGETLDLGKWTLGMTWWKGRQPLFLTFDSETLPDWFGMPDDADLPSTFSVEYVRAWKRR